MLGEKNPLSVVIGPGVGVSAVGKVVNLYKTVTPWNRLYSPVYTYQPGLLNPDWDPD